jgi:hypothetical protein
MEHITTQQLANVVIVLGLGLIGAYILIFHLTVRLVDARSRLNQLEQDRRDDPDFR